MRDSAELLGKCLLGFPRGTGHKKYACRCRGHERQWAGSLGQEGALEGAWQPLQYSFLGNSMDRGAWQAIGYGVTKNWT